MVSANKAGFDLRETFPLPRNILHRWGVVTPSDTGQRANPKDNPEGYRSWLHHDTSSKELTGDLNYPARARDSAKSGLGHKANRYLNYLIESVSMNVGGFDSDAKASSLPMPGQSVGGVIVIRTWESHVQGEGHQGINISRIER
jgi:predicted alpha/beta superfamily hydrolase